MKERKTKWLFNHFHLFTNDYVKKIEFCWYLISEEIILDNVMIFDAIVNVKCIFLIKHI